MRAVGYRKSLPITDPEALIDIDLPDPTPNARDVLVRVKAVSVNPVDVKVRAKVAPPQGDVRLLGFDAAGVVEAVGSDTSLFKPGDEVYYSGSIARQGTDAEFHVVDERIVGRKPASLTFPQAAAMPLTTITAWELLFHRLGVSLGDKSAKGTLLVINGAGGVGSILIQLARQLTGLTVIATASRPEGRSVTVEVGLLGNGLGQRPVSAGASRRRRGVIDHRPEQRVRERGSPSVGSDHADLFGRVEAPGRQA